MKVEHAIYDTVHEYGVEEIALRLQQSPHTVQHKANPHAHHQFSARELITIQATSRNYRINHAMAQSVGGTFVEPANLSAVSDDALLDQFTALVAELGRYAAEFNTAWADGRLTGKEFERVRDEAYQIQQRLAELDTRMASLVDDRRPVKAVK